MHAERPSHLDLAALMRMRVFRASNWFRCAVKPYIYYKGHSLREYEAGERSAFPEPAIGNDMATKPETPLKSPIGSSGVGKEGQGTSLTPEESDKVRVKTRPHRSKDVSAIKTLTSSELSPSHSSPQDAEVAAGDSMKSMLDGESAAATGRGGGSRNQDRSGSGSKRLRGPHHETGTTKRGKRQKVNKTGWGWVGLGG